MKDLKLVEAPLVGFARGTMCPLGAIKLQLTLGAEPTKATSLVEFLVVDLALAYNVILGRLTLNALGAIPSTYHQKMKFEMPNCEN